MDHETRLYGISEIYNQQEVGGFPELLVADGEYVR